MEDLPKAWPENLSLLVMPILPIFRSVWEQVRFAENLIVCEDVDTARSILKKGYAIAYVPGAAVSTLAQHGLNER